MSEEAPKRKYATIYLNDGNCYAHVITDKETFCRHGITEKNVNELVKVVTDLGYFCSLYRISNPQYFAESNKADSNVP